MFRKLSLPWLSGIAIGLMVLLGLIWILDNHRNQSFDTYLVQIDSQKLTRIELYPQLITDQKGYILAKQGADWVIKTDSSERKADAQLVQNMLTAFNKIRLMRLMSRDIKKWPFYCVTDSVGSRVKAYAGDELVADIHIGAQIFLDPSGAGSETHPYFDYDLINSYVRRSDSNDVYMASGFFSYHFTRPYDAWYDRTLISADPLRWDVIKSAGSDSLCFILERQGAAWLLHGKKVDEAKMSAYLGLLSKLRGRSSLGGYPTSAPLFVQELQIISKGVADTLRVRGAAYANDHFFFESTQNPGIVFAEANDSLFRKVFTPPVVR